MDWEAEQAFDDNDVAIDRGSDAAESEVHSHTPTVFAPRSVAWLRIVGC